MQAGGVYLAPTLQTLKSKGLLKKAGETGHITIVSNDGIPQEFDAIRKGQIDATVSQPADAYAKYGMYYIKAAMQGKTFKPGPDRPRLRDRQAAQRHPRGPAARAAGHQGQRRRRRSSGATRSNEHLDDNHAAVRPLVEASASPSGTVPPSPCRTVGSPSCPASPTPSSAATAPASPPWSPSSPASRHRTRAPSCSTASPRPRSRDRDAWRAQGRLRLPEADGRPGADGRREPVHQPAAGCRRGFVTWRRLQEEAARAARHLGRACRPRGPHRRPQGRGPPDGGDRTGVERRRPLHRPRRADRPARQPRDRAPLHPHAGPSGIRRHLPVHLAPPPGGVRGLPDGHRAAGRPLDHHGARRANCRATALVEAMAGEVIATSARPPAPPWTRARRHRPPRRAAAHLGARTTTST